MLRHDVWARLFQRSGDVVGRRIPLDGVPTTIIGVMPEGFSFPAEQEIWTPLIPTAAAAARETPYARYAYGRLADGASLEAARAELQTIGDWLARAFPATNQFVAPTVSGFDDWFVGRESRALYLGVWGAAGCVLLIVCGNIANLFVLQAIGRSNEVSVRQALGASPARLVRQIVLEAGLLAVAGGAIAWWVTGLGLDLLRASQVFAPMLAVDVDIATFGYLWALCSVTACVIGGAAAVHLIGRAGAGSHTVSSRTVAGSPRASRLIDGFVGSSGRPGHRPARERRHVGAHARSRHERQRRCRRGERRDGVVVPAARALCQQRRTSRLLSRARRATVRRSWRCHGRIRGDRPDGTNAASCSRCRRFVQRERRDRECRPLRWS